MNERNDEDATIRLDFGDWETLGTRHNMTLFTFIGEMGSRDHVFLQTEATDPETKIAKGTYVFRAAGVFDQLAAFMWEYDFPMQLNNNEVPPCDEIAYQKYIEQNVEAEEIGDFIPEGWE